MVLGFEPTIFKTCASSHNHQVDQGLCPAEFVYHLWSGYEAITRLQSVRPDLAISWTLCNFLKPLVTINLPKSLHSQAIFVKVTKSIIFLVKSFFGQLLQTFGNFFLVTLTSMQDTICRETNDRIRSKKWKGEMGLNIQGTQQITKHSKG